ncbi:hypothetical protein BY996DRAFT_6693471 [Phakopsora pachyrhizi]|nr:hypothetical protein BY996DRAFT_6693471 [Phakopsora pachyrhizi]
MLKDSVDHFKLESKDLKKTRSKKIPLELFFKTIDSYADSKLINSDLIQRWIQTMGVKYSEKSLINLFLSHKKVAISRSLIVKFQEVFKNQLSKELENSVQNFLDSVEAQIRKNCGEVFYIANHQVNSFLASLPGMYFKVREKSLEGNSGEHKSQNINKLANIIVGSLDSISWTNLFSADENLKLFEKREIILKSQRFQNSEHSYKTFLNMRFTLRKLFLVYSTIINKIFCEGEKDLMENFLERQKNAISFFDTAWKLLEVDDDGLFFIDNDRLPLNGGIKEEFLSTYYLNSARRHPVGSFQFKFTNKRVCKIDVQWKIIALWLAGRRLELYKIFYTRDRKTINSMFKLKNFINSVFLCLLRG